MRSLKQHFHSAGINSIWILPSSFPWLTIGSVPVAAVLQRSLLMFPIIPAAVSRAHGLQVLRRAVVIISLLSGGLCRAVLPVWIGFFLQALCLWQSARTPGWLSSYKTLYIYHLSQCLSTSGPRGVICPPPGLPVAALEPELPLWSTFICLTLLRVLNKLVSHCWPRNVLEALK